MRAPLLFTVPAEKPPAVDVPTDPAKLADDPRFLYEPDSLRRALIAQLGGDVDAHIEAERIWCSAQAVELARLRTRQPRSAWAVWPGGEA